MNRCQGREERSKVMAHIGHHECAILNAEVGMWEERKYGHNLILMSESGD